MTPGRAAVTAFPPPSLDVLGTTGAIFNVKDYGAVANGVTDDTAHIQSAINAAIAIGGGIVLFPAGAYLVAGSLLVTKTINMQGVGASAVVLLVPASTTVDTIIVDAGGPAIDGFSMRDLAVVSLPNPRTAGRAIYLVNTSNALIDHVDMTGQYIGCEVNGGGTHRVTHSVWNMGPFGVGFKVGTSHSADTYLDHLYVTGAQVGFNLQYTGCVIMNACECTGCNTGLLINPGSGQVVRYCFFECCAFDSTVADCITITATGTGSVGSLVFTNCWSASTTNGNCCAIFGAVDGIHFIGQRFLNSSIGNGLWVSGATNIFVDACVAAAIPQGTGFCFLGNAKEFAVRNSHSGTYGIFAPNKVGIQVLLGCANYMIANNTLKGNTFGNLVDSGGTSVPKIVANNLSTP
jgi:hypothetical protein